LIVDEVLQAVQTIYQVDGTEEEIAATVDLLRKEFPHAKIIDLIFHDSRGLTPEQVVEEAMRREAEYAPKAGLT
jgi:hypothetical protein